MLTRICRSLACVCVLWLSASVRASEPVVIAQGAGERSPKQPQAAIGTDGAVHLIYGVGDAVFYSRSTDGGETFTGPQQACRTANMSLGMRRGPRIAVAGKGLVVTAIGGSQGKGRDGDVQAWRSSDDGATWQGPVRVNDADDSAREGLHGMASGSDGSVWCVWLDLRDKRSEVYGSKSTDGGATWQKNVLVYRSPSKNVCECCHPSVIVSDGAVHVMFRNSFAGNRDMYMTTSKDGGKTFANAKKLGQGTWKLNACPMDGGMLAPGPNGSLLTVWRRDGELFTASSTGGKEQFLARGEQPWIAATASGPVSVWTDRRDGDLWLKPPGAAQPQKISEAARGQMVVASASADGPVIACWESKRGGETAVLASRIDISKRTSR